MSNLLKQAAAATSGFSQENPAASTTVDALRLNVVFLPLAKILDNPYQPRQLYEPAHILDIGTSLADNKASLPDTLGLQQVPAARVGLLIDGQFVPADKLLYSEVGELRRLLARPDAAVQLCFGHSRKRAFSVLAAGVESVFPGKLDGPAAELAAKLAIDPDYARMPIRLAYADNEQMWQHALTENGKRKNINPLEEASAIQSAITEFGYTYERAAQFFGYEAKGTVANKIRLLDLPDEAKDALRSGQISERHARTLVALRDDPKALKNVLKKQLNNNWPVAKLEEMVRWERKAIDDKAAEQREWDAARAVLATGWVPPGSIAPLPLDRVVEYNYNQQAFNSPRMNKLLEDGHCTTTRCKCMAICYRSWGGDPDSIRPDANNAPHIELVCTDRSCRDGKMQSVPDPEQKRREEERAAEKRKEAEVEQSALLEWEKRLRKVDLVNLWNDVRFWRIVADRSVNVLSRLYGIEKTDTIATIQSAMLDALLNACRSWASGVGYTYDTGKMDQIIGALTRPLAPPAQPGPGDSQSTNWQQNWSDEDEEIYYDELEDADDQFRLNWVKATLSSVDEWLSPALLLRLIEESADKTIRGQLWRIYNQVAHKEEEVPEL